MKNTTPSLLALLLITFVGAACSHHKDTSTESSDPAPATTLTLTFNSKWGSTGPLSAKDTFRLADQRGIRFGAASFIVSHIRLVAEDGQELSVETKGIVVDGATDSARVTLAGGTFPAGHYRGIRFRIGLDSATNHQNMTKLAQTDPLNRPDMTWGWNPQVGYFFLLVQARYDTSKTPAQHPSLTGNLEYTVLTDSLNTEITALENQPFELKAGGNHLQITADWLKLFEGIEVRSQPYADPFGGTVPLIHKLQGNLKGIFSRGN